MTNAAKTTKPRKPQPQFLPGMVPKEIRDIETAGETWLQRKRDLKTAKERFDEAESILSDRMTNHDCKSYRSASLQIVKEAKERLRVQRIAPESQMGVAPKGAAANGAGKEGAADH